MPEPSAASSGRWTALVDASCTICRGTDARPAHEVNGHRIVRCTQCGHKYVSPRPAMEEVVEIYGESYFENPAFKTADVDAYFGYKDYLSDRENIQRRLRQVLDQIERNQPVGRLVDVGCGMGLFVEVAAERGWDAWGVELNKTAVEWAQANISDKIRHGTLTELGADDGEFDCVTMFDVIEHVADPREVLLEVNRILRPDGQLVVVTPDAGAWMSRAMGSHWLEMKRAPEHLHFFTVDGLARLLGASGFDSLGWHSIGKISTVKTMMADLRFYSAKAVDGLERAFTKLGVADSVIDLDPRTKLCLYARKTGEPLPLEAAPPAKTRNVPRMKLRGIGRVGLRRVKPTEAASGSEFYDMQKKYWEGKERFLDPRAPGPRAFAEPKLAWVADHIRFDDDTSVLDVGAGNGTVTWYLAEQAGRVVGIDFSTNLLTRSPCARLMVQGDATRLPFQDDEFDVVFESNFLHHVDQPLEILREMARVAKRHVVLIEPNRWHLPMSAFMVAVKSERRGLRFDRKAVERLVADAGLRLIEAAPQGAVYPNITPPFLLGPLARFDRPGTLGAYVVAVAEVVG